MAQVAHPAVAQIHGVESWRGRLLFVVAGNSWQWLPVGGFCSAWTLGFGTPSPRTQRQVLVNVAATATDKTTEKETRE